MGLGSLTRPRFLVAIDVHHAGAGDRSDLLTFGEVNALVNPDDIDLFEIADQHLRAKINYIDHTFRMQHTDGHWIWLRVRCELSQGAADAGLHLIGIAVDITEQKSLAEKTVEADLRLRDAIETIPEAFVLWDATTGSFSAIRISSGCTSCPTRRSVRERPMKPCRGRARSRRCGPGVNEVANRRRAHGPSRRNLTTEAGCISASAGPRTAATFRSAPTSRASRNTSRSWSIMIFG